MGDQEPGSSTAAQGAPTDPIQDPTESERRRANPQGVRPNGWFARMKAAFSSDPSQQKQKTDPTSAAGQFPLAVSRPGMMNLRRMRVDDVAIPKVEIVAVPLDISKEDLVQVFRESGLTRLPVYKETLDTPVGLVHLKDFSLEHGFNGSGGAFDLEKMLRPLIYAPPSMPIGVLLQKMQSDRMHMALVIDEYGGVDGLVTLEDLVEQVIGEIEDEHDIEEDVFWTQSAPGVFVAQAKAPLEEFEAAIGLKLADEEDDEEIDTLGGLVFLMSGRVPARGEVLVHPSGAEFEIVDADPRRIKRVRVRLPHAAKPKVEA